MNFEERLIAIKARVALATPGPWIIGHSNHLVIVPEWVDAGPEKHSLAAIYAQYGPYGWKGTYNREANAEFIAHAREDIPWLLQQIDKLLQERETWPVTKKS